MAFKRVIIRRVGPLFWLLGAMRKILLGLIIYCIASIAVAKCANPSYLFSGQVTDTHGVPIQGAAVGISWALEGVPRGPELGITDRNGQYAIQVEFPSDTSFSLFGDKCTPIVREVSISASGATHYSVPLFIKLSNNNRFVHKLVIDKPTSEKVLWPVR